ncbi:DUF4013 domain-containing protein [Halomicroarcula sp. GCM10025817]|uniref:DUF4013 domain-containing protein n=1 Tax=Haloarcula TaxID=2237 RepID=UPI0023E82F2A|nr:DUF4013 domain-containing protein [Halomicroarcula sp. SYNS111]
MLEDALKFPWKGEKNVETIIIGGVLSLLGVFIIPTLFVYGYLVRVIRQVGAGDDEVPPVFDEWGELLVDGVLAFVISLVYFLVPAIVISVGVLAWILPVGVGTSVGGTGGNSVAILGVLLAFATAAVGVLTLLAAVYLFPAAIAAFARTGSVGAAFSPSTIRTIGTSEDYAVAWLIAIVIGVIAQIVAGAVAVTVLGLIFVPFITFYGNIASAYAIGRGIEDADRPGEQAGESATGRPAV